MSATGFAFKGSGFYLTDYGKNAHREKGTPTPASPPSSDGARSEGSKGDSAKSESGKSESGSKGESASSSGSGSGSTPGGEPSKPAAKESKPAPAPAPAKKSSAEWIEIFNKAGVPCGPIYSIDQMFADPQVEHIGIAQSVAKKDGSKLAVVGQPVALSRTPSKIAVPPPEIGQHTDEVLAEFGFGASEIAALHNAKVL